VKKSETTKICYIAYRCELETNLEHISRYVSENRYEVTILNISSEHRDDFERRDGSKIKYINLPNRFDKRAIRLLFILKVVRLLRRNAFSIVHVESSCRYFGFLKVLVPKPKYIYHALSYPMYKRRWHVLLEIIRVLIKSVLLDAVLIQSKEQKDRWVGVRNLKKTQIVPIGFDHHLLHPVDSKRKAELRQTMGVNPDTHVIVYSGAMVPARELDRLIDAIAHVVRRYPNATLMMVGEDRTAGHLKEKVRTLNLEKRVIFTGRIPHHRMIDYYGVADIGVSFIPINSNYTCNPPLKTYEYLACGVPCVATATISNQHIIKNGRNGILVNDTAVDVARGILELLADEQKRRYLQSHSPQSVGMNTFEKITHRYVLLIYEKLLKNRPSRANRTPDVASVN
jgi:glycosyltransferase involved in cell wall biosynthesis